MIAPPIPCSARDRIRKMGSGAAPHSADAAVKSTIPAMNTRFRPYRSPAEPAVRTHVASVRA